MDPVRIPGLSEKPTGLHKFIPFEGFNPRIENGKGTADFKITTDLPAFELKEEIHLYLMNHPNLHGRVIEYREYTIEEINTIPELEPFRSKSS